MEVNNGMLLGLTLAVLGGAMLVMGRQQYRRSRDLTASLPLTSWHFKVFIGGGLFMIALNVLFQSVKG